MTYHSITENFSQYFRIKIADTHSLRETAYKIRYGVYSYELGWEQTNTKNMEVDEYDAYAYHCLIQHKRTEAFAGCIRLIIPPVEEPNKLLPFEVRCLIGANKDVIDSTLFKRGSFGEISRTSVLSSFRRRDNEQYLPYVLPDMNPDTVFTKKDKRNFPNIAVGLYLGALACSELCNHKGLFVLMEPCMNRRLRRLGLPFVQAGAEIDFHGKRALFYMELKEADSELKPEIKALYRVIYQEVVEQLSLIPYVNLNEK